MSQNHHDPIPHGSPANSDVINTPFSQLDEAISKIDFAFSGNAGEYLNGQRAFSVPAGTGDTNGHVIQAEGVDLAQRTKLDFQGASVKAQNGGSATEVLINGAVLAKNVETLSDDKTLTDASEPIQALTITADQNVNLPAEAPTNPFFVIFNDSVSGFTLAVKDDSPATVVEIEDGESALLFSDGAQWFAFTGGGGGGGGLVSPLTTKGDIWVYSTTDARLPVGTNGYNIQADSSQASGLKYAKPPIKYAQVTCVYFTGSVAVGDGKGFVHIPAELNGYNLVEVHARVITAGVTGTTDIQLHNVTDAVDMLSTKLTIDSGETGSDTAATPAVINAAVDDVATNDLIRIDVDAISTTAPKGLIVTMGFQLP